MNVWFMILIILFIVYFDFHILKGSSDAQFSQVDMII